MPCTRPLSFALVGALLLSGLATPAVRADEDPAERLDRREADLARPTREIERLRAETARLRQALATSPPPVPTRAEAPRPASRRTDPPPLARAPLPGGTPAGATRRPPLERAGPAGVRWGGYLTTGLVARSDENSYFALGRLVLAADAAIGPGVDLRAEVEIENGGVTDELDGEIALEQAELTFHLCDRFHPKLGAILVPFTRWNLYHEDPWNDFTNRPFIATYLVPTGFAQPGAGFEGSTPFGRGHSLTYEVAVTSGYRDDFDADEGVRDARQRWSGDENRGKQVWGHAAARWRLCGLDALETGLSGTWARYDAKDANDLYGWGADVLVRRGPFEARAEYVGYHYDRSASDPPDAIRGPWAIDVEGAYHFMPSALRPCRSPLVRDTSLFTLAARYQHMDLDDRVRGATFHDDLDAWSVALDYRLTERTVFRLDHTWYVPAHGDVVTEITASFSTFF